MSQSSTALPLQTSSKSPDKRSSGPGLGYVLPGVLVVAALVLYPVISIIVLSLTADGVFAAFANFSTVINARNFGRVVGNTFIWVVGTVFFAYLLGLIAALILNQNFIRLKGMWRSILLLAWIVPSVVKATIWKWIYSSDFGILNHMLMSTNIIDEPVRWLSSTTITLPAVMLVQIWATFPFAMLMLDAGLQAIPGEQYEAAEIDGANIFQQVLYITIPSLSTIIFIVILILAIWSLNEFAVIWIMTQGGPAGSSQVLALSIYKQFQAFEMNQAAATSLLQLAVSALLAFIYIRQSGEEATA